MKAKVIIFILVLSLAINGAVLGTMGYHYYRNNYLNPSAPCPVSPGDHHLYQELAFPAQQLAQMEPLAQKFHGRLEELGASMEGKKESLVDLLGAERCRSGARSRDCAKKWPVFRMRSKRRSLSTS